jgi:hypothetical protein
LTDPRLHDARTNAGHARLLAHLELMAALIGEEGPSASARLHARIGPELTARLLELLTGADASAARRASAG